MLKISFLLLVLFCLCSVNLFNAQGDVPPVVDANSDAPSDSPVYSPTFKPTRLPSYATTLEPSPSPTETPSAVPTDFPTYKPTAEPTGAPTSAAVANTETLVIIGVLLLLFVIASAFILGKWFYNMCCGGGATGEGGVAMNPVGHSSQGYQTVDTTDA